MVRILAKLPSVPVLELPVGVRTVVSNLKTMAVLAGKLVPLIATCVPGGPEAGLGVLRAAAAATVKVVDTVKPPAVTEIIWEPEAVVEGIVTVVRIAPVESTVVAAPAFIGITVPSNLTVMAAPAGKYEPVIKTSVPTGPERGDRGSRVGAVTVKAALAWMPVSMPVEPR